MFAARHGRRPRWFGASCLSVERLDARGDLPPDVPRSLRSLPRVARAAFDLVRCAAPREFALSLALRAINGLVVGGLLVAGQRALQQVFDAGSDRPIDLRATLPPVLAFALLSVGVSVLSAVSAELESVLGTLVSRSARERVLTASAAVDLRSFELPAFHDRLERAVLGAHLRPMEVVNGVLSLAGGLIGIVAVGVALSLAQPWLLPLAALAAIPLLLAAVRAGDVQFSFTMRMTANERERAHLFEFLTSRAAAAELRALNAGALLAGRHRELYDAHIVQLRRAARQRLRFTLHGAAASALISGLTIALLLWLAATQRLSLAEAGMALGAVVLLSQRLATLVSATGQLYESARFVHDMSAFIDVPVADPSSRLESCPSAALAVRLEDVSFTYPGAVAPAVLNVTLSIDPGEIVALVGENGSGKTTLAKLLARLYRPDSGRLLVDGVNAEDLEAETLRDSIAVVFQDYVRFVLTAAQNIAIGNHRRMNDLDAVARAASEAGIDDALRALPCGYDTLLAPEFEGGADLSLGQWQRVALARAFFRDAPLVVLDEPTAALDPRAEHALLEQVRALFAGRSVLVISHRLSSVREADRIHVMDAGKIVETGSHEELMDLGGRYAELFRLQAAPYSTQKVEVG